MDNHWLGQNGVTNGQANRVCARKHTWTTSSTAKATASAAALTRTKGTARSRTLPRSRIASTLAPATTALSVPRTLTTATLCKQHRGWIHQ